MDFEKFPPTNNVGIVSPGNVSNQVIFTCLKMQQVVRASLVGKSPAFGQFISGLQQGEDIVFVMLQLVPFRVETLKWKAELRVFNCNLNLHGSWDIDVCSNVAIESAWGGIWIPVLLQLRLHLIMPS